MIHTLEILYQSLASRFGPQAWPASDDPRTAMVESLLAADAAWPKVARAVANLAAEELLRSRALSQLAPAELVELLRPLGSSPRHAQRLAGLVAYVEARYDGDCKAFLAQRPATLREELMTIRGVSRRAADMLLLYAAHVPLLPVDTAVHRVLKRHGWVDLDADADAIQAWAENQLPDDVVVWHALSVYFDRIGREHCGIEPHCEGCALTPLLPSTGPIEPEA